jgi:hypothetical protein
VARAARRLIQINTGDATPVTIRALVTAHEAMRIRAPP